MSERATICTCGTISPGDARYCEGCGRPVDADDLLDLEALAEPSGRGGGIGLGAAGRGDDAPSGRRRFWLPVVVALALVAGTVGLVVATTDDTAEPDGEEAADPAAESDDGQADDGEGDDATAETGEGSDGLDPDQDDAAADGGAEADAAVVERYEPLSADADYLIVIGTAVGTAVFDAGTGEFRHHEGSKGVPVAAADGWLVVDRQQQAWGAVAVPLDDPGGQSRPFRAGGITSSFLSAVPRDGLVVLETYDDAGPALVVMDIAAQEVVPHPVTGLAFADVLFGPPFVASADSALFSPVSGGLYHLDDTGARLLAPGRLVVSDGERTLVEWCDEKLECSRSWVDEGGEPLDLALPPDEHDRVAFAHGTDWVASNFAPGRGAASTMTLTDIATGRRVETRDMLTQGFRFFWTGTAPPVSPDGRWVVGALEGSDEVEIRNLVTDEVRVLVLPAPYARGVVFAARP